MRTRGRLSRASSSPRSCSHANTRTPFLSFRLPEVLFACEHASTFLELPATRGFVRMRTREHLSGASGSPKSCSHANTRAPFSSFRQPEVLFACEHASTFLGLPAPRGLVRMRTRKPFQKLPATRGFVRMRTRGRLSRASDSPGLFACEHAGAFLELPAPRGLVRMRTREHLSGASGSPRSCSHANTQALSEASSNPRFCSHANTQPPFGGTKPKPSHLHPET